MWALTLPMRDCLRPKAGAGKLESRLLCRCAEYLTVALLCGPAFGQPIGELESRMGAAIVRVESATEDASLQARSPKYSNPGIVISDRGYIVVNAPPTRLSEELVAIFPGGLRNVGRLVAKDIFSNLALVKLDEPNNDPAPMGKSADLNVGDLVYGVRSAADGSRQLIRSRVRDAQRLFRSETSPVGPYIEIDAPEDFPASGPIFNVEGKIVGFITLRTGPEHKTQVFLALPIEEVVRLTDEMRVSGKVRRSRIGIAISSPPSDLISATGLEKPAGAFVAQVDKDGPAERGGMRRGDIIVRFASKEVRSTYDYLSALERIRAGTRVTIEVLRGDARQTLSVITGEVISGPPVGEPARSTKKVLPDER